MIHAACGKSWSGLRRQHCPACCQTFNSDAAGDRHRVGDHHDGRRCLTPDQMRARGMVEVGGVWVTSLDRRGR